MLIDVPKDVQNEYIELHKWPEPQKPERPEFDGIDEIEAIAAMIHAAERPIVYFGGGAIMSDASQELLELIERIQAPATSTLMGLGGIPTDHALFIGMLGMHAAKYTNLLLEECDCLIALGVRFDDRATGKVEEFCPRANIVHIDIDHSEIGKIKNPSIALIADLKNALDRLLPLIQPRNRDSWLARMRELKSAFPLEMERSDELFSGYGPILKTAELLGEIGEYYVTTDVGQHQMRVAQCFPFQKPRQWATSGGLGTMGFGLPTAIGIALEHPDATVFCFTGDGSLLMNIQELAVVAEENLNIKIILCNNQSLGLVYQQQQLFYEQRSFASQFRSGVDFAMIAAGFGLEAYDLAKVGDPLRLFEKLITEPGGALINIPTELAAHVFPMVPPGGANKDMLHAGNISIEREEALA